MLPILPHAAWRLRRGGRMPGGQSALPAELETCAHQYPDRASPSGFERAPETAMSWRSHVPSCAKRTGNKHKARTMRDTHRMNCLPHSKLLDADHAPSQVFVLMDRNHTSLGMLGSYAPTRAAARSFHSHGLAHRYRRNRWQEARVNVTRTPPFRNPSSLKCQVGPDTALS